jgi:hypothetical protein
VQTTISVFTAQHDDILLVQYSSMGCTFFGPKATQAAFIIDVVGAAAQSPLRELSKSAAPYATATVRPGKQRAIPARNLPQKPCRVFCCSM